MIHDILEEKLEAEGFAPGANLFRQFMPSDITIGVMTRVPLEGIPVDVNMPGYYKGRMQVIVRHTDPVLGREMAAMVSRVLTQVSPCDFPANSERNAVRVTNFYPETLPIEFPSLESDGIEWSIHFKTAFTECPF